MNLREYETIFILRPDAGDDEIETILQRLKGAIESKDGVMLQEQNWGKKKLAYEVKKHIKGRYFYFLYIGPSGVVEEFERHMKMIEAVIKFQTVKISDWVNVDERKAEIAKQEEEKALKTAEEADEAKGDDSDDDKTDTDETDDSESDGGDDKDSADKDEAAEPEDEEQAEDAKDAE